MGPKLLIAFWLLSSAFLMPSAALSLELETRYAIIVYDREADLSDFNDEFRLRGLSYLLKNRKGLTVADDVKAKVDVVIERVKSVLEMFPKTLRFRISLLKSDREVQQTYQRLYGRKVDFIAFYSPRERTVFISINDINLRVFSHEIAHVVVDAYFGTSPSVKIHEVLAQYAEEHLED